MITWLAEHSTTVFFILGLCAFGLAVGFWMKRDRKLLIGLGVVVVLVLVMLPIRLFMVTEQQKVERAVKDMADSVAKKDANRIFSHISDQFGTGQQSLGAGGKKRFRDLVDSHLKAGDVTELVVWDFKDGPDPISKEKKGGQINFLVKAKGPAAPAEHFRCVATFALEPDGEWRMVSFKLLQPQKDPKSSEEIPIPGF